MSLSRALERLFSFRRRPCGQAHPRGEGAARRSRRLARDLEALGLLSVIGLASALLLLPRGDDGLIGFPSLEPGEVAPRTVKSPRAFSVVDPVLTAQTRERARRAVRPVFDHLLDLAAGSKARLKAAFEVSERSRGSDRARVSAFADALGIEVDPPAVLPAVRSPRRSVVFDGASMLLEALFSRQLVSEPSLLAARPALIVRAIDAEGRVTSERELTNQDLDAVLGPNQARALVDRLAEERLAHLPTRLRRAIARVVKELLTPNLVPNVQETLRRRRMASILVKPSAVVVARGERIVREGERVTERDLLLLEALMALESPQARLQSVAGSALLGMLLAWIAFRSARYAYRHRVPTKRDLVFLASAFVAFLLLVWLGYKVVQWLVEVRPLGRSLIDGFRLPWPVEGYRLLLPLAAVAIVIRLCAGPIAALAAAPVFGLLAGWMMDGDLDFAAYALAGAFAAASTEEGTKRMVFSAGARAAVAQALAVLGTVLLAGDFELPSFALMAAAAGFSGAFAALIARAVLPAVETLFGFTTPTGLSAFANAEHPLMRELLVEVPGTYHHSLHVGALAEAGAKAIGSDRLLARVGGFLHDVGRLGGPLGPAGRRRFAERLSAEHRFPSELSQILSEQPHEGAPKGRAGRPSKLEDPALPPRHLGGRLSDTGSLAPVRPGTTRLGLDASPEEEASEAARSPRPRSKTSALVFLADRVEEALFGRESEIGSRALLDRIVAEEVRGLLSAQLLDEAALELRELAAVSAAFANALEPRFVRAPTDSEPDFLMTPPPTGAPS